MGMPATERTWTRDEVLDLIARNPLTAPRYELVDGVLLVTPAPNRLHQNAVAEMLMTLRGYLRTQPQVGQALMSPADVMLEAGTTVGPDVFVMSKYEAERLFDKGPIREVALAVEVLSPRDRSGDRTHKRRLYQRRIPEYWIVDAEERCIEVWLPDSAAPMLARAQIEWRPAGATTPLVVDVALYFARVHGESH
jgi:Uma2 family endonuclease